MSHYNPAINDELNVVQTTIGQVTMTLPTAREINPVPGDLDGQTAVEHFLGRSLEDAVKLFQDAFEVYQEDLLFMGPSAFCFYLPAAILYAESSDARHDPDIARTMLMVLSSRWECDQGTIGAVREMMLHYCQAALGRIPQMQTDHSTDGDLEDGFRKLIQALISR
jgi:hypothetical protein